MPVGRRGKARAILPGESPGDTAKAARALIGSRVGQFLVREVLVQARTDIREERFAAFTFYTAALEPVLLFSREGGIDVEERVAEHRGGLTLRDWLEAHGVIHVAMESTGVYWKES